MPALSIAWRLLLALALTFSPIVGMASGGDCAHAGKGRDSVASAQHTTHAMHAAMPDCAQMAGMPAKTPQGKSDAPHGIAGHAGCASGACCLGGSVGMGPIAFSLDATPAGPLRTDLRATTAPSPPRGLLLRPPIA